MAWTKEKAVAASKAWKLANKEKAAEQQKAYHLKNKEKHLEQAKANYLANKEKHLEQAKANYLANKEKRLEQQEAWQKANPEKKKAHKKAYYLKLNLANKKISRRTLAAWSLQVRTIQPKCMTCWSTDNLHAHHIAPKIEYPELALLLLNGITLCKDCHIKVHAIPV